MKLISMTAFVLEDEKKTNWNSYNLIVAYAKFLKQPLELWMFVPVDENGEAWDIEWWSTYDKEVNFEEWKGYQQAKERCLFDVECVDISNRRFRGLKFGNLEYNIITKKFFYGCNTVEDVIEQNIELTQTAIKHLGL